ncbi:MAG TPA: hypothetical protein VKB88_21695 [Bryobacteraceae bacterium]|nr:hypothetical protein [Bryobacteraceae bacterium]
MNAEQALFAAFVIPAKRERYVELLGTKRGRERVRGALDHFTDLDPRFCRKVPGQDANPVVVLDALRKLGAPPQCHVISVHGELDGCDMPLSVALQIAIGKGQGTFISCITGVLGYFEGEEPDERYICQRER